MYRTAIETLFRWKQSKHRKPLIIEGARQVGKTWLMKEFGRQAYADTVYINFDSNSRMAELFASPFKFPIPPYRRAESPRCPQGRRPDAFRPTVPG